MTKDYYNSPAVLKVISLYERDGEHERLGQFFCNRWIVGPWPSLYHMEDEVFSRRVIAGWLKDHCYYQELPTKVRLCD